MRQRKLGHFAQQSLVKAPSDAQPSELFEALNTLFLVAEQLFDQRILDELLPQTLGRVDHVHVDLAAAFDEKLNAFDVFIANAVG